MTPVPHRLSIYTTADVERFRRQWRMDPYEIRRWHYALFGMRESHDRALSRLPAVLAEAVRRAFDLSPLHVADRRESVQDGSLKLLFEARDGARFESVLLRAATGRTSACVSTQVGCGAGCPFCATARLGLRRQLTAAEILEQVRVLAEWTQAAGRRLRNIVFMGMGEPLDNEDALWGTLDFLLSRTGFAMSPRRLTVSTVGLPDAMRRLVDRFPGVQLAVSLHSARPELRTRLIPWSRRYAWDELREAIRYAAQRHAAFPNGAPLMIEHLLLDGVNDGPDDARALVEYLQGIPVMVNLIPYNPIADRPTWAATPRERRDEFARPLRAAGIFTTIRYSLGAEIAAACGQLTSQRSDMAPA